MLEQGQDIAQNTSLKLRFIRCPERPAQFEGDPEEARRTQAFRIIAHETNTRGCEPFFFEIMRGRTDRARTIRSDRHQKDSIHILLKPGPGVVHGTLCHYQLRGVDITRYHPITKIPQRKVLIVAAMQPR